MVRIEFSRLRFLVIDDNAHMCRMLGTLLHGFDTCEVHEAEDGAADRACSHRSWARRSRRSETDAFCAEAVHFSAHARESGHPGPT
jgi:CheY-like chemotaxis protein